MTVVSYLLNLIGTAQPYLLILGILIGFIYFKKLKVEYRVIIFYLIFNFLFYLLFRYVGTVYKNNLLLVPVFGFFELLILGAFYLRYFLTARIKSFAIVFYLIALTFISFECLTIDASKPLEFQSYSRSLDAFTLVLFSMLYFFQKLSQGVNPNDDKIRLNATVLIYYSLNLIFLLPNNYLINENSFLKFYFWFGYAIITVAFQTALIIMLWKNGSSQK